MGEQRQRYNEEFKRQTVRFIQEQTKTIPEIAADLNIPTQTLYSWMGKYRQFEHESLASVDKIRELEQQLKQKEKELQEKERRIADMEVDLAILKKAVHIFGNQRN